MVEPLLEGVEQSKERCAGACAQSSRFFALIAITSAIHGCETDAIVVMGLLA